MASVLAFDRHRGRGGEEARRRGFEEAEGSLAATSPVLVRAYGGIHGCPAIRLFNSCSFPGKNRTSGASENEGLGFDSWPSWVALLPFTW